MLPDGPRCFLACPLAGSAITRVAESARTNRRVAVAGRHGSWTGLGCLLQFRF